MTIRDNSFDGRAWKEGGVKVQDLGVEVQRSCLKVRHSGQTAKGCGSKFGIRGDFQRGLLWFMTNLENGEGVQSSGFGAKFESEGGFSAHK